MREKISRSQKKRAAEALQRSGMKLVALGESQLEAMDIPVELKDALLAARRLNKKHEAYRRQVQYIGRLMREMENLQIDSALLALEAGQERQKRQFACVERWRDELVAGDDGRLDWISDNVPGVDRQQLARLVADARGSTNPSAAKVASRQLFRYLSRLEVGI